MAKSKLVQVNEKIEKKVVGGYKKIEESAVGGFNKIADKFVDNFLTKEGESVEEAKERLAAEQKAREAAGAEAKERRLQEQNAMIEKSKQNARNATMEAGRKAGIDK